MPTENETQQAMFVEHQMSEPKATIGVFNLPCGFLTGQGELLTEVQVREITGVEEDMLSAKNIPAGKKITQLIAGCLERLGTISSHELLLDMARNMVIGDRVFLTLAIRRVTLGDLFPFEDKCKLCSKKSNFSISLADLAVRKMPDPMKRVFDVVLPSKKLARFHVMTGKDEEVVAKLDDQDSMSAGILARLDTINEKPVILDQVKALGMRDRNFLRDKFDEVEGGVETSLDLVCPACGGEFRTEMNVGSTGFFFPSQVQKNSKPSTSSS